MFLLTRSKVTCLDSAYRYPENLGNSLYRICSRKVEELISYACSNIQKIYGNYDEEKCREKIEELQRYILANLPAMVFDDLCEIREVRVEPHNQDIRVELALYMHRNMRKFFIKRFVKMPPLTLDRAFWAKRLTGMENLVVLDLNLSCTDELLEIVSENCHKLAYIDIVSRVEAMHAKQWQLNRFNALKLKYCVSDVGLGYLCKCKLLRKIKMNRMFRSQFGGGLVTPSGIRKLVKSLPLLQNITFEDMGIVLADDMEDIRQLSLTCLSDYHPEPAHIEKISRLCPDLKQLCLKFYQTNSLSQEADVLRALTSSSLKVCELQLLGFLLCDELTRVIQTKGCYLNSLAVEHMGLITSDIIRLIGRTCPNLINLHLSEEQCPAGIFSWANSQCFDSRPAGGMFGSLRYLALTGKIWIPNDIMPLCLASAKELKVLKIHSMNADGSLDTAIAQVVSANPLRELKTVYLCARSRLTIGTIQYFFRNCPGLMELLFLQSSYITQEHVDMLCDEMQKQNFTMFGR